MPHQSRLHGLDTESQGNAPGVCGRWFDDIREGLGITKTPQFDLQQ